MKKNITLSEKSFKRFAKRYQQMHQVSLTQAQEALAKIFGAHNYYELINNFSNDLTHNKYEIFYKDIQDIFFSYYNIRMVYFVMNESNKLFLVFEKDSSEYVARFTYLGLSDSDIKRTLFKLKTCTYDIDLLSLFKKHIPEKNINQWARELFEFLKKQKNFISDKNMSIISLNKNAYSIKNGELVDIKKQRELEESMLKYYVESHKNRRSSDSDSIRSIELSIQNALDNGLFVEPNPDNDFSEDDDNDEEKEEYYDHYSLENIFISEMKMDDSAFNEDNLDRKNSHKNIDYIEDFDNEDYN